MRNFIVLLAAATTLHAAEPAPKPVIPEDVRVNLTERLSPGIVIGIVSPGGETYLTSGPVDADTIFEIGSITKTFTATLLADMAAKGEVKPTDPVAKYLPDGVAPPKSGDRAITLEDLATQRSGLPRMPENFDPADPQNPYLDYTPIKLYAYLPKATLAHPVGSTYDYSNVGMGLLGYALTLAAKSDYDTLVKTRIAGPLGMTSTSIATDPSLSARVATGHVIDAKPVPAKAWTWKASSALAGAGALRSTARDMLRYVAAYAGLTESPLSPALRDAQKGRAEAGSKTMEIALAWHVKKSGDRSIVWHNGGTGGFHSFCGFDPQAKVGVVVLANSTEDIDDIGMHLLDPSSPLKDPEALPAIAESKLARLDGFYDLGGATITVSHEGTQLYAQLTGQDRFAVFPKSERVFFFRVVPAELEFDLPPDGPATKVTLHQGGRQVPAARVAAAIAPKARKEAAVDPKVLAAYAGKYELAPGVIFDVAVKEGHLGVMLTGQPRLDVYPESETKFFYKVVDAQISFVRDEAGKVTSLVLHQAGAERPAKKID